jgi:serine/threonine-protein kinase
MHEARYRPGEVCGDWEVVRFVAAGGIGEVYEVRGRYGGKRGALKLLKRELQDRADIVERFETETRILASIEHPCIVGLHHAGRHEGRAYLVMEWLDGVSLRDMLNFEKGPLPLDVALHYAISIATAVDAVYREAGVVHRDLKPENILMLKGGGLKVLDFGLGKFTEGDVKASTSRMGALYTPHYAAPEQLQRKPVDDRTDVYALALIFLEMVTGRYAYADMTGVLPSKEVAYANQLLAEPNSLRTFVPDAPKFLLDLIDEALSKDREKRPRATTFLSGLVAARQFVQPSAPTPVPDTPLPRAVAMPAPPAAVTTDSGETLIKAPVRLRTQALPAAFTPASPAASPRPPAVASTPKAAARAATTPPTDAETQAIMLTRRATMKPASTASADAHVVPARTGPRAAPRRAEGRIVLVVLPAVVVALFFAAFWLKTVYYARTSMAAAPAPSAEAPTSAPAPTPPPSASPLPSATVSTVTAEPATPSASTVPAPLPRPVPRVPRVAPAPKPAHPNPFAYD